MSQFSYRLENKWGKIESLSFNKLFSELAKTSSNNIFLVHYAADGKKKIITHSEFWQYCKNVAQLIDARADHNALPTTADGNRWQHMVVLIGALWSRGQVALLNPHDPAPEQNRKLQQLPNNIFFPNDEIDQLVHSPQTDTIAVNNFFADTNSKESAIHVFTSGSTGQAKIVQQSRLGLFSNAFALIEAHDLNQDSIIATPLPVFHVNTLCFSFICSLISGSKLVIYEKIHPTILQNSLKNDRPTIFSANPPVLRLINDFQFPTETFNSLKYFLTAASPLSNELACDLFQKYKIRILQGYGLSECTNFSTLTHPDISNEEYNLACFQLPRPSIGSTLLGNQIEIRNLEGDTCLPEETGEIFISGDTLMLGYINSERIKKDDYFATGDTGFYRLINNKKYYFHTGRKKDVCKIFGHTIGLVDIDEILSGHFQSSEVISIAIKSDSSLEEELVICLTPKIYSKINLDQLVNEFSNRLPYPCVPRKLFISEGPMRNASGKPFRWNLVESFYKQKIAKDIGAWKVYFEVGTA